VTAVVVASPPTGRTTATRPGPSTTIRTGTTATGEAATLLAAGDIADCSSSGDEATAALLDARPAGLVATLGDNVYDRGTAKEFADCYAPTWGRHRDRTRPAPGNHDYDTFHASGYFGYFGAAAGDPVRRQGYYSYDLGSWHVIVLNSNCGGTSCEPGGTQERWLRADLAASGASCTLAYWHHPRFSSGSTHGSDKAVGALFQALYDAGADVVLAGHEHNYERFAPLAPSGDIDPARGIRTFVVGTGGRSHYGFGSPITGSEVRNRDAFGVLVLTLEPGRYHWQFVPEAGKKFTDSGTGTCH
jgi:calcineurin-like phosphoesterase family protein